MIVSILVGGKREALQALEQNITRCCPQVKVKGKAACAHAAAHLIQAEHPDLIFLNASAEQVPAFELMEQDPTHSFETIFVAEENCHAVKAAKYGVSGYIQQPISEQDLLQAIQQAEARIRERKESQRNKALLEKMKRLRSQDEMMGIPTMDGFEFVPVGTIIRCEGLQKCTRIVTQNRSDIVSSYNLGEFRKLLEPYGFFLPHKSYLINLSKVKCYKKEGTITMVDGGHVPVSRRKKQQFVEQIKTVCEHRRSY